MLLDHVIAARAVARSPGLHIQDGALDHGHYVGLLARERVALRDQVNAVLLRLMRDGTLERIYRRWGLWDEDQAQLFRRLLAEGPPG